MQVLLITRDRNSIQTLVKCLREQHLAVEIGGSEDVGTERKTVHTYDVIVLDWIWPDTDGPTLCRELRARGVTSPIFLLAPRDVPEDRVAALNSGADDCLSKPVAFAELLARIRALDRRFRPMHRPAPPVGMAPRAGTRRVPEG